MVATIYDSGVRRLRCSGEKLAMHAIRLNVGERSRASSAGLRSRQTAIIEGL
jgi:hypothetical protein